MKRLILLMLLAMAGTAHASDLAPPAKLAQALTTGWQTTFNKGDAAALSHLYAEDAVLMPPTDETLVTRAVIEDYWAKSFSSGLKDYHVDIVRSREEGNVIYVAGIWSAKRILPDGQTDDIGGNVVRVLERQGDGTWKTRLETWN